MAWIYKGRKYWYHKGRRYSRKVNYKRKTYKKNKSYFWTDGLGNTRSTDYQGYLEAKFSGKKVGTNYNILIDNNIESNDNYIDEDIWNFSDSKKTSKTSKNNSSLDFNDIDFDEKLRDYEDKQFDDYYAL